MKNENTYHAVVKLASLGVPQRMVYMASDVPDAIRVMCKLSNVSTTTNLHEFEILQVLGSNNYRQVAMKPASKVKPHVRLGETPVLDTSKIEDDVDEYEERTYKSYKLEVA